MAEGKAQGLCMGLLCLEGTAALGTTWSFSWSWVLVLHFNSVLKGSTGQLSECSLLKDTERDRILGNRGTVLSLETSVDKSTLTKIFLSKFWNGRQDYLASLAVGKHQWNPLEKSSDTKDITISYCVLSHTNVLRKSLSFSVFSNWANLKLNSWKEIFHVVESMTQNLQKISSEVAWRKWNCLQMTT